MANKAFLKLIKQLESSGGRNTAHRTIASGIHAGDTAVGEAGLMPLTAQEMANRRIKQGTGDVNDDLVVNSPTNMVESMLQGNDDLRSRYVNDTADKVLKNAQGDPELAATGWLYGHNLPKQQLQEKLDSDPEYQDRIDNAINDLHLQSDRPTYDIKALEEALGINKKVEPFSKINNTLKK